MPEHLGKLFYIDHANSVISSCNSLHYCSPDPMNLGRIQSGSLTRGVPETGTGRKNPSGTPLSLTY